MRKIAIANRKGGAGKITTAINLLHGFALIDYYELNLILELYQEDIMETLKIYPEASMHHFHFPCFFCGREVSIGGIDFRVKRGKKSYPVCRECANPTKDIQHRIRTSIDNLKNKIEFLEEVFKTKVEYPTEEELSHEKEKLKRWKSEMGKSTKAIDN